MSRKYRVAKKLAKATAATTTATTQTQIPTSDNDATNDNPVTTSPVANPYQLFNNDSIVSAPLTPEEIAIYIAAHGGNIMNMIPQNQAAIETNKILNTLIETINNLNINNTRLMRERTTAIAELTNKVSEGISQLSGISGLIKDYNVHTADGYASAVGMMDDNFSKLINAIDRNVTNTTKESTTKESTPIISYHVLTTTHSPQYCDNWINDKQEVINSISAKLNSDNNTIYSEICALMESNDGFNVNSLFKQYKKIYPNRKQTIITMIGYSDLLRLSFEKNANNVWYKRVCVPATNTSTTNSSTILTNKKMPVSYAATLVPDEVRELIQAASGSNSLTSIDFIRAYRAFDQRSEIKTADLVKKCRTKYGYKNINKGFAIKDDPNAMAAFRTVMTNLASGE